MNLRILILNLILLSVLAACNGGGGASATGGAVTEVKGSDPLYEYQWHLNNTAQKSFSQSDGAVGIDINQESVFDSGIRGRGVKIAVSDSGIEVGHEDLAGNFLAEGSKNFFGTYPFDGNPIVNISDPQMHGTGVTGIIAAVSSNGKGGRGVASSAKFGGFNFLSGAPQSTLTWLIQASGDFDIYNYSYGSDPSDYKAFPNETIREATISGYKEGVKLGRNGKGSIYVKAAGNEFEMISSEYTDEPWDTNILGNSSLLETNNYPYTIIVGAINANGNKASYSSPGSNLWVSAPGGEYGSNAPAIVTTDLSGCVDGSSRTSNTANDFEKGVNALNTSCNYTSTMNGTSSATPVISGVVALMLEANANLSWRDVKHILAETSNNEIDSDVTEYAHPLGEDYELDGHTHQHGWIENKAGYSFHNYFGFGLVDTEKAVLMAKNYTEDLGTMEETVDPSTGEWIYSSEALNYRVPNNSPEGVTDTIEVKHDYIVEAIQVKVTFEQEYLGNIGIELTSPAGTKSIIMNTRSNVLGEELDDAIFSTNAFYGESSFGKWTLKIIDGSDINPDGTSGTSGILVEWGVNVFGHVDADAPDLSLVATLQNFTKIESYTSGERIGAWGSGAAIDSKNNIYMSGYLDHYDSGDSTRNSFLTKYNSSGIKTWTQSIGSIGARHVYVSLVVVDKDDNVYVGGATSESLNGAPLIGIGDPFLMKFDSSGNNLWTKLFEIDADHPLGGAQGIDVDENLNIYVVGLAYSDVNATTTDTFLVKFNSSGEKQWTNILGAGNGSLTGGQKVNVDLSGNLYVSGYVWGAVNGKLSGESMVGNADGYLAKYDSEGNKKWVRLIGCSGCETTAYGLVIDSKSNIYISGINGSISGNNVQRAFLAKYDSSGEQEWVQQYEGTSDSTDAIIDKYDNIAFTGTTGGLGPTMTQGCYLISVSPGGRKLWTQVIQGGCIQPFLAIGKSNSIVMSGTMGGSLNGVNANSSYLFGAFLTTFFNF